MVVECPDYLEMLISAKDNGLVKIITGLRRCGKTYLVKKIFSGWLRKNGVTEDRIIYLALDKASNADCPPLPLDY